MKIHGRKRAAVALISLAAAAGAVASMPGPAGAAGVTKWSTGTMKTLSATPVADAGGHLTYHGGPLINNVVVTPVVWGSWNYGPATHTGAITQTGLTSAMNAMVNSRYIDWLTEYNAGTNHIGRGSVDVWRTVSPGSANDGSFVDDTQIASVLQSQIASGALPAASDNRLYTLFFRKGQVVTREGRNSVWSFCGYHGNTSVNGRRVWFAVIPFEADNGGCQKAGYSHADNLQAVLSHEVIEAVTDPAVRDANAWYDNSTGAEIGDICAWRFGMINNFVVQKEWSNAAQACIVHK